MDRGVEQHVFSTENLYALPRPNGGASIATNLAFKSVAEGLLHEAIEEAEVMIGEEVMGFVLHDLFGIKDATESALDEIKESLHEQSKMLKEIQSQINDLKNEVKFYADQIQVELEQLEFTLLSKPADIAAKNIEVRHNLLTGYSNTNITELKQSEVKYNDFTHEMNKLIDEITSTDAGVWNDLNVIEENLKSSPGTTGMLELWSKAVYTGKEKNVKKAELPSLTPEIYDTLWSFYNKYLTAQLQGYTLLVEAYNARSDFTGAQIAMEEMNSTITEQVLQLRPLIEQHLLRLNDPIDLQRKEFPVMEIGVWYEFIGWENVPSLFHTLDQDITWILGSMKYPPRYNSFTARVILSSKTWTGKIDGKPVSHNDFADGLPLTLQEPYKHVDYTVVGTRVNPNDLDIDKWVLRYDFYLPPGDYILADPLKNAWEGPWQEQWPYGKGWFVWDEVKDPLGIFSSVTAYDMSTGHYRGIPWIEVLDDTVATWGGTWYGCNPVK